MKHTQQLAQLLRRARLELHLLLLHLLDAFSEGRPWLSLQPFPLHASASSLLSQHQEAPGGKVESVRGRCNTPFCKPFQAADNNTFTFKSFKGQSM